jgi:hypothetical protein
VAEDVGEPADVGAGCLADLGDGMALMKEIFILTRVQSTRAKDYVREFNTALAPWRREPVVREFIHRTCTELGVTA